ncbi:MAG TPA: TVP38/TMEM64 family protein [Terriglobia bacterium]|nr:TVP38/TMEM64 family protein [Terriglobia bacterium]
MRKGIIIAVVAVAVVVLFTRFDVRALLRETLDWTQGIGPFGQVLFAMIYIVATVLLIPGSALGLGAGALFGVVRGSLLVSVGSTLGATCAFLLGRYLTRGWVAKKIEGRASFTAIDRAVAEEGWKIVFLARLSPVFPFTLLNYAFGLTRVSLRDYVLASWIGMMPGTVMYVYLGSLARADVERRARTTGEWILYGVGLLATIIVAVFVARLARKALANKISPAGKWEK